ncbi:MAG: hypothetical protein DRP63_01735 [Planctomycetota bacterium]|nr:MAG: hypothetical protein DRP63_01735 [Planctomycetota bacterium]
MAALLVVSLVVAFSSAGCSRRSKKHKKEPLQITIATLPAGYEGQTGYSATLTATGGAGNYTWNLTGGNLPSNLIWDATAATISGDIAAGTAGDYPLQFEVTDGVQTATASLTLTVHAQLQITTTTLPDGYEGQTGYSATLGAVGGTGSYTWSVVSGDLPPNLALDSSTGVISGNIVSNASSGSPYNFTVEVTDGQQTARKQFDLVVQSGGSSTTLKADFEANPAYGTAPLTVTFTDKSTGNPTSWEWDFDNDGTPDSTQQSPTHTYNNPGWYTVKLTVSDGTNSNTCVKEKYIQVASGTYYVDGANGDDGNGGTGWNDAFATIGKALSVADDYDLVLVADATYNETDLNLNGKKIYLKGVDHNTTGAQPVIDCQQAGRAFYFGSGETGDCVIDNFVIQDGRAKDTYGGAIVCENKSSPTIMNCVFENNKSEDADGTYKYEDGGAIYCVANSGPVVTNCTFSNNSASGCGGAIYCDSSSPSITNCAFSSNSANWGGTIYCYSSSPTLTDCTFSGNSALLGGVIYCYNFSSPSIANCTFSGNSATNFGGAIHYYSSSPSIANCTFSGNYVTWFFGCGGAIYCTNSSSSTVTNCTFNGNSAPDEGGVIWCYSSSPSIINCVFSGNSAGNEGGAIYCHTDSNPSITNCTFSGNSANDRGGAIDCYNSSSPTLNNSILWDNSAGSGGNEIYIADSGSSCTLNYCCVDNTGYGGQTGNITENNCVHQDAQFVDAANGDYRLKDTSACIDAGDNTLVPSGVDKDLDGNPRIVDGNNDRTATVDIGAYEYQR